MKVLEEAFFERDAELVARDLLGMYLVTQVDVTEGVRQTVAARIHETEAYVGPHDLACHARVGRTARTEVMFGPPGRWYVYLIYGMYWMLNVVTGPVDYPAAVLFRGAGEWIGPGRLTRGMSIDKRYNGLPAEPLSGLWIEDRNEPPARGEIKITPRIGVDYAGEWKDKPLRYLSR